MHSFLCIETWHSPRLNLYKISSLTERQKGITTDTKMTGSLTLLSFN